MKVAIIGAGQMGNGIAHVFAQNGHEVNLIDLNRDQLDNAMQHIEKNLKRQAAKGIIEENSISETLLRIATFTSIKQGAQDRELVIEAATEHVELKLSIFKELSALVSTDCILATNTSSISITKIAAATQHPNRVIGMHFMNPVPVMKLVEVIKGYSTSADICDKIMTLSKELGKVPVEVNDYPGFVANRILMPMINEAIATLHEGVAGVQEIDTVMKLGMAHPMGPLQLADFIGLDTCLSILEVLHNGFGNPKYAPSPLLVNMVTAGKLGIKTLEGFYNYAEDRKNPSISSQFNS